MLTLYGTAWFRGVASRWEATKQGLEQAHVIGCTAVSWAPADAAGSLVSAAAPTTPQRRLCSAGCDNTVKVNAWPLASHRPPAAIISGSLARAGFFLQVGVV
jgi:hypothetical protein